jgi:hypothetical protein
MGGGVGFEFARGKGEEGARGGYRFWLIYEAYEVKNKRENF